MGRNKKKKWGVCVFRKTPTHYYSCRALFLALTDDVVSRHSRQPTHGASMPGRAWIVSLSYIGIIRRIDFWDFCVDAGLCRLCTVGSVIVWCWFGPLLVSWWERALHCLVASPFWRSITDWFGVALINDQRGDPLWYLWCIRHSFTVLFDQYY